MEYRRLGNTDLRVSVLGFGCSHLGRSIFEDNRKQAPELLETAFDAGINFFDSAPTYSYGDSERLLGKVFASRRDQVILATKGGFRYSSYARYARYLLPIVGPLRSMLLRKRVQLKAHRKRWDFSRQNLSIGLENSLRRLRTDHVDIYQLHNPPSGAIGSEEVLRFLEDLVAAGKARYCAASVGTIAEARLCLKYPVFSALQIAFNLVEQEPATVIFPLARSAHIGLIVKTPLYRGMLTSKYRVATGPAPEPVDVELQDRRRLALDFLVSEQHPSIEIASLRFILDHPEIATLLTGTSNLNRLRRNIDAVAACSLRDSVMASARGLAAVDWNFGARDTPADGTSSWRSPV